MHHNHTYKTTKDAPAHLNALRLANTLGTEEPIYGPDAIQPVSKQDVAYTELKKEDLKWKALGGTNGMRHRMHSPMR